MIPNTLPLPTSLTPPDEYTEFLSIPSNSLYNHHLAYLISLKQSPSPPSTPLSVSHLAHNDTLLLAHLYLVTLNSYKNPSSSFHITFYDFISVLQFDSQLLLDLLLEQPDKFLKTILTYLKVAVYLRDEKTVDYVSVFRDMSVLEVVSDVLEEFREMLERSTSLISFQIMPLVKRINEFLACTEIE